MAKKPTYEELEQRVKELKKEVGERRQAQDALQKAYDEREKRIEEQSAELSRANTLLKRRGAYRTRAEEAMRESEGFSSSLLNNSPNPILVINPDTSVRYVNPALEEITDFSSDELIGKKAPYPWWTEETLHKTRDDFEEAIHKGARRLEELFQKKNGEQFWVDITSSSVKKDGKLDYYLANWVETTERKQAEERVKHLNLVLQAIRDVNQLITGEKDREKLLQGVCASLTETRGYYNAWIALFDQHEQLMTTAEAGMGSDFLSMINYLKRGQLTDCAQRALKQSEVVVTEDPFTTCAGCPLSKMYADRGAMTIRLDHAGKPYGVLSTSIPRDLVSDEEEQSLLQEVAHDIAFALYSTELEEERKRTQEALLKTEERFRRVIENIFKFVPEGLLTFTDKLNLFRKNKAFQDIVQKYSAKLNYTEQELTEIIIEQVKNRIINEDNTEIRIPKNKE